MAAQPQQPFVQSGEPLNDFLRNFWQRQVDAAEQETPDYRHPPLPLARIKKVMKSDPDVKMIAADAPILFCKACEIFIAEITARAFIIADSNKRRTLSRADIAKALSKSDQFDFLIDIVPRDDLPFPAANSKKQHHLASSTNVEDPRHSPMALTDGHSPTVELDDAVVNQGRHMLELESLLPGRPGLPSMRQEYRGSSSGHTPPTPIDHQQ